MLWEMQSIQDMQNSFKVLHYILMGSIIALLIAQLFLKQIRPLQLLIIGLIYIFIVWQRISTTTLRMIIVAALLLVLKQFIDLLYFCFGEEGSLATKESLLIMTPNMKKNTTIISSLWIFIMMYAILLCWRVYEKSKLYLMLTNQFILD